MTYDVIVVGGGTSGMMAAIQAAQQGVSVALVEKNRQLGRKLLLTGGGRCNVTNRSSTRNLIDHIPGNGKFLYGALSQFDAQGIVDFFEEHGVELKEEDHGRMFPVTDKSMTIVETLVSTLRALDVHIIEGTRISGIQLDAEGQVAGVETEAAQMIRGRSLVLAMGGATYPGTGSTGDGYDLAQQVGHTIQRLYPTEVPLVSDNWFIREKIVQGVSLRDVLVSAWSDRGDLLTSHRMDMIFTHFGLSGPAVLRTSGHVNRYMHESGDRSVLVTIDCVPDLSLEDLKERAEGLRDRLVLNVLKEWVPERLALLIQEMALIGPEVHYRQLDHAQVDQLFDLLKAIHVTVQGSLPIEKGFVTGGGVTTDEVNPSTMESKLVPGLYFCGELLDINGYTGGYNITAAFVTGYVAGQQAAWSSMARMGE